jgi:hypothetical protein
MASFSRRDYSDECCEHNRIIGIIDREVKHSHSHLHVSG